MQQLIQDLLVYSRTKSTDRVFEKTDLGIVVAETVKELEESIAEKKALVKTGKLCSLNIIRFQFRQFLHNLISNSLKFSRPGAAPRISIKSEIVKSAPYP
jgi:light-regulated signal transduction histidine kinase (bacteriophytochrome)